MTAPTLSPAEQVEVTRFGMHDEEILDWHEEHVDEHEACGVTDDHGKCERDATHVLVCNRCNRQASPVCDPHARRVPGIRRAAMHSGCGAFGPLAELVRVVPR